jgi:predicted acetyltransferase
MDNNISLYQCNDDEYHLITNFYYDDNISDCFNGIRLDRIINADLAFIIKKDDINIGFILLVNENNKYNIDSGILRDHCNKGYGSQALKLLKQTIKKYNINYSIQVKKEDEASNKRLIKNNFNLFKETEKYNYYK